MIRRSVLGAAGAVLAALAAVGPTLPAAAIASGVEDFSFESISVDYRLGRDADGFATLRTVETIVALFPETDQNRGIIRAIPTRDRTAHIDYDVDVRSVTDANGRAVPYETSTTDDAIEFALGTDDYVHGRTTYVITYTERNVVHRYTDTRDDEFYWDVNGTDAAQPFGSVSARIRVAPSLRSAFTGNVACYRGAYSSSTPCAIAATEDGYAVSEQGIGPYQGVTVAIGFRAGTFAEPPTPDSSWLARIAPWILLLGTGLVVLGILVGRIRLWRDARGRGIVVPEYEPPAGLGVLEAAQFLGKDAAALPALFVQFAVSGAAKLTEDRRADPDRRYSLVLIDESALTEQDDRFALDEMWGPRKREAGSTVVLDRDDQRLGDRLTRVVSDARTRLRQRGLRARSHVGYSALLRLVATALLIGAIALAVWGADADVAAGAFWLLVVLDGIAAFVLLVASGAPERLTRAGAELREQLLGLRDYLRLAEEDRLRVLQSPQGAERTSVDPSDPAAVVKLYERLLPWAMVWGLENQWAAVLGAKYATTPVPTSNVSFASNGFLTGLGSFSHSMALGSFATTPPVTTSGSSSFGSSGGLSGGSFGGGFSGGGGGGGGFGGR